MKTVLYFLLTGFVLCLPSLSSADSIKIFEQDNLKTCANTICLPSLSNVESIKISEQGNLKTCASAILKAFLVFNVGEAFFSASDCENRMASNVHKKITFAYELEIPAHGFSESSFNFLKKNLTPEALDYWKEDINAFNLAYKAVDKGDRYDIEHIPGRGLLLYFNDVQIAHNNSDDFASLYLTIWFGEAPFNEGLKEKLLSK